MRFSTAVRATAAAVAAVLALTPPAHAFDAHTFRDKQGDVKAGPGAKKWMKRTTDIRRVRVADLGKDVQVRFRVTNLVLPRPDASGSPTSFTASTKIKTNETLFARIEIYPDGTTLGCLDSRGGGTCDLRVTYSLRNDTFAVRIPETLLGTAKFTVTQFWTYLMDASVGIYATDTKKVNKTFRL